MTVGKMQTVAVVGLGFGDEGKGSVVDFLAEELSADWIIRANGGAQAGHNVITGDGRHHTFSQFSAGSFRPRVKTYLSRFFFLDLLALRTEAEVLRSKGVSDPLSRLYISTGATILTPLQRSFNRLRELIRGKDAHGSCGLGIGEAFALNGNPDLQVFPPDLAELSSLHRKLARQQDYYIQEADRLSPSYTGARQSGDEIREILLDLRFPPLPRIAAERMHAAALGLQFVSDEYAGRILKSDATVLFEGAQGMLLDQDHGFWPHVTPSHAGYTNPLQMLREHGSQRSMIRLGVIRTYMTRHGVGPLPTCAVAEATSGTVEADLPELHNNASGMQGDFRRGWPDLALLDYAILCAGGIDGLALTHADRFGQIRQICRSYENLTTGDLLRAEGRERTRLLEDAIPRYEETPPDLRASHTVGCERLKEVWKDHPLEIISHGPRSNEKTFTGHLLRRHDL
jgi:adenylosuccinate synthase